MNEALLYETLFSLSSSNEPAAWQQFCTLAGICDVSQDLEQIVSEVSRLTQKPIYEINDTYLRIKHCFSSYPFSYDILSWKDPLFPSSLNGIHFLYTYGDLSLLEAESVTLLGQRSPSQEAKQDAVNIVSELSRLGACMMSTLDTGLDAYCVLYAYNQRIRTVIPLASPLHQCMPESQKELMESVANSGLALLVSPFSPAAKAQKWFTVPRNDLLVALTRNLIILDEKDGGPVWKLAGRIRANNAHIMVCENCISREDGNYARAFMQSGCASSYRKKGDVAAFLGLRKKRVHSTKTGTQLELF